MIFLYPNHHIDLHSFPEFHCVLLCVDHHDYHVPTFPVLHKSCLIPCLGDLFALRTMSLPHVPTFSVFHHHYPVLKFLAFPVWVTFVLRELSPAPCTWIPYIPCVVLNSLHGNLFDYGHYLHYHIPPFPAFA